MSEYQRYEFMTIDKPLTRAQLDAVEALSSHIEASSTHAVIEYNWGDFKHDPIKVLHKFFDGFLYWANWGSPQLAFRFPHGILPADLLSGYDLDDYVTFTAHQDYDILDIEFGEMEAPDEWTNYDLGTLIDARNELIEGDQRSLYILWLAAQERIESVEDDEDEDEDADQTSYVPPVPPAFGALTAAQKALAELFQVSEELLAAAAQHSEAASAAPKDDFAAWIALLPQARRDSYLLRLARNEPGLSHLLVRELRELGLGKTSEIPASGKRISYTTLVAESVAIRMEQKRKQRERAELARLRHLQSVYEQQDQYWEQIDLAAKRGTSSGYDEATKLLNDLREAAQHFNASPAFDAHFAIWIQSHLRRPALLRRLLHLHFPVSSV